MIPIKYRLDSTAEEEYTDKALSCIPEHKAIDYSCKLEKLLNKMVQQGRPAAGAILNKAKRFSSQYPDKWCLCEWLVMPYDEIAEIRKYLYELIGLDLEKMNICIENTGCRIMPIKSYHDLRKRRNLLYPTHKRIAGIVSTPVAYDCIYKDFTEFSEFYDDWSRKGINCWITEKTGLKVCPYCNISYTYNRGKTATAQLDHFFPKSEYPILALCFYNLVPCCPACNKIKLDDTEALASPYKDGAFKDLRITWTYNGSQNKYGENNSLAALEEMIEIEIETDDSAEQQNLTKLKIKEAYQQHKDYASEIIKKARVYTNSDAQKLICDIGASMGITPEEVERFYLGNYLDGNDLQKRPLSKMTKDFYQEIVCAKNAPSS